RLALAPWAEYSSVGQGGAEEGGAGGEGAAGFPDAGLVLGRSFRVSWGPDGRLAVPGAPGRSVGGLVAPVLLRRVLVEGAGAGYAAGEDAGGEEGGLGGGPDLQDMDTGSPGALLAGPREASGPRVAAVAPRLKALRSHLTAALKVQAAHSQPLLPTPPSPAATANGLAEVGLEPEAASASPPAAVGGDGCWQVPQWRLQVTPLSLPGLVAEFAAEVAARAAAGQAAGGQGPGEEADEEEQQRALHQLHTWRLLQVLFQHISLPHPATRLPPPSSLSAAQQQPGDGREGEGEGEQMVKEGDHGAGAGEDDSLGVALQRQADLSAWLQSCVKTKVERELVSGRGPASSSEAVLLLLSGHQLAAGAALAAAGGDTRLATLVAAAGCYAEGVSDAQRQIEVWAAANMTGAVAPDRLAVYRLLAGQVLEVNARLRLDWRRFLGLLLWYSPPPGPPSPPPYAGPTPRNLPGHAATAIQSYALLLQQRAASATPASAAATAALGAQGQQQEQLVAAVPPPLPPYAEEDGLGPAAGGPGLEGPLDLQFSLLQLWAALQFNDQPPPDAAEAQPGWSNSPMTRLGGLPPQPLLPGLVNPGSHSSNPCDALLSWQVMSVLQALGVLPGADCLAAAAAEAAEAGVGLGAGGGAGAVGEGVVERAQGWEVWCAASLGLVSQLLSAGDMAGWAMFVALHLPDAGFASLRSRVVWEVLCRSCPAWCGDPQQQAFLLHTLRLPGPMLAAARALYARHTMDAHGACMDLMEGGEWAAAHRLALGHVAPALLLKHREVALRELLQQLAPHTACCPALAAEWALGGGLLEQLLDPRLPHLPPAQQQQLASAVRQAMQGLPGQSGSAVLAEAGEVAPCPWAPPAWQPGSLGCPGGVLAGTGLGPSRQQLAQRLVWGRLAGRLAVGLERALAATRQQANMQAATDLLLSCLALAEVVPGYRRKVDAAAASHVAAALVL
ncbi:hypothetical protein QJQ45_024546, partial [Haematococcus lacustris]